MIDWQVNAQLAKVFKFSAVVMACCVMAGCASKGKYGNLGVKASPRVVAEGEPIPKGGGVYRVGKEYVVGGRVYQPKEDPQYDETGIASWYGRDFHGRLTANGEIFDMNALSVAHKTLPMPSYVRVTNLANGRSIMARVNDRGPYHGDREIDLSYKVAQVLGVTRTGTAKVRVQYAGRARLDGKDDHLFQTAQLNGQPVSVASLIGNEGNTQLASREKQQPTYVASLSDTSPAWRGSEPVSRSRSEVSEDISSSGLISNAGASTTHNIDAEYIEGVSQAVNSSAKSSLETGDRLALQSEPSQGAPISLELPRPRPQI